MTIIHAILSTARDRLVTMSDSAAVVDAARLLNEKNTNLVIACNSHGLMTGVITKTDVVRQISACTGCSCTTMVADIMTSNVITCNTNQKLIDVWLIMKDHALKQIPVCDDNGRPLGLLYANDALQVLLKEVKHEEMLLRDYVMGIGYH